LLGCGVVLKLFPMFCVALGTRFSRRTFIFACSTAALSLFYLYFTMEYVLLIRRNVPTTFILSYGYKAIFIGLHHLRIEAGLKPLELADTWVPACTAGAVLICAASVGLNSYRNQRGFCLVNTSAAGTAFLFGAGIYCGTYLLGTNFIYLLMFLLLCIPQLLDWQLQRHESHRPLRHIVSCALAKWECERAFEFSFASSGARLVFILLLGRDSRLRLSMDLWRRPEVPRSSTYRRRSFLTDLAWCRRTKGCPAYRSLNISCLYCMTGENK
jgi:hypothetical protein